MQRTLSHFGCPRFNSSVLTFTTFARPLATALTHTTSHHPQTLFHCRLSGFPIRTHSSSSHPRTEARQYNQIDFAPFASMDASKTAAVSIDEVASTLKTLGLDTVPQAPNTYPTLNPVDIYRSHITEELVKITGIDAKIVYPLLAWTTKAENGDLQLAVPALRQKDKKADAFAQEIVDKFPESPLIEKPVVKQEKWVGFFFKPAPLTSLVVPMILKSGPAYGFNMNLGLRDPADPAQGRKKMIVEFSSPNIAKPFHAGHLRSTIIGGFLANLYEGAGWDVYRMNYLGDWGKQYGVLALGFDQFGSEEELVKNPIGHLYDVYVKISKIAADEADQVKTAKAKIVELKEKSENTSALEADIKKIEETGVDQQARDYFKCMVDGEEKALGLWKRFRDLSIEKYKQTYARLNIRYDEYSGESQVSEESMETAAKLMAEKGVTEDSEGAVIVDFTKHVKDPKKDAKEMKKLGKAIVKKKDGTSLYLTRDIGEASTRYEKHKFDNMIYVVASQQDLHLAQLFKIMELMGHTDISTRCQHINFGMVLGMSTRKGTAKFLDDILRDVGDKMHEVMRSNDDKYKQVEDPVKTADTLGISAVMVQDMKGKRINNYNFDMDRMTSFEGDTGPYLQYAHARLCSIHRKVSQAVSDIPSDLSTADLSLLNEPHAIEVVRQLAAWPDMFLNTVKTQEPTTVLTYLFKMVHTISSSYDHLQVVGSEREVMLARLALYGAARQVLNNGMRLLGLSPVERM
ncbi:arginyl-tRNA synthetase [Amniculicola lignicola CBS 123094]|uniref:arginine--tRNA ligase n=1 Tax=Amniculicola lignicola CBS 123094 TaxID=1392246 RepID=A0A6A5WDW5_9PLEO|nr:arginyl-tRNA synthetase [Amniculicola lignicola CBS 123094]